MTSNDGMGMMSGIATRMGSRMIKEAKEEIWWYRGKSRYMLRAMSGDMERAKSVVCWIDEMMRERNSKLVAATILVSGDIQVELESNEEVD